MIKIELPPRGLETLFGVHDQNIKYLESLLKVQVHIHDDDTLTIDGPAQQVDLVERLVSDYVQLRSEGVRLSNSDLKSVIRIISEDQTQSLRGVVATTVFMSMPVASSTFVIRGNR